MKSFIRFEFLLKILKLSEPKLTPKKIPYKTMDGILCTFPNDIHKPLSKLELLVDNLDTACFNKQIQI